MSRSTFTTADLAAVLRPLEQATNLPPALYASARVLALEQDEIFGRMWLCVGREEDLLEPGDWLSVRPCDSGVLLLRGDDGEIRAFHNVCRHRGACLVDEGRGSDMSAVQCRYHAWTYDLRGDLVAAPFMRERAGFDPADHSLGPVRLERWGGFLFVNLDEDAPPLAEAMADFPDLSRYGLERLRYGHREVYEIAANWKLVCENYSECYHCALVHPQLHRLTDFRSGGKSELGACYNGGPMELNEGFSTMSMSGEGRLPEIPGIAESDRRLVHYYNLYPNFLLALAPDHVLVHVAWPLAPGRTRVTCDWLLPPEALAHADAAEDIVRFWDVTNRQDWGLCELVQKASGSPGARPGPYHPTEACVHAFDQWLVGRIGEGLERLSVNGSGT